jgi:hypothetical protein
MMHLPRARALGLTCLAVLLFASAVPAQRRNLYTPDAGPSGQTGPANQSLPPGPPPPPPTTPYVGGPSGFATVSSSPVIAPFPGYGGFGNPYQIETPVGGYLQGLASVTSATGQYYNQIQQARITREQSRQMALDTQRKQIEQEMWYESVRPTAPKLMKQQEQTDLDWARNYAQRTEIWSGRTLNVLLKSVLKSPYPTRGPNIPLDDTALRGLNLTDGASRGNLSMTRNEGKIVWPEGLQSESFDELRGRFGKSFETATRQVQSGTQPSRDLMKSLHADLKALDEKLNDQVRDLSPGEFIQSRRTLNQLNGTLKGLSDPRLCKSCHGDWRKSVRTVGELVAYCEKNGLVFGPAVDGEEASYTVTYYALRNYERSLVQLASAR